MGRSLHPENSMGNNLTKPRFWPADVLYHRNIFGPQCVQACRRLGAPKQSDGSSGLMDQVAAAYFIIVLNDG